MFIYFYSFFFLNKKICIDTCLILKIKWKKKRFTMRLLYVCVCNKKFHHHSNSWMTSPASANVCRDTFVRSGYNIDSFIFTSCFCVWLLLIIIMIILFLLRKLTKNAHSLRSSKTTFIDKNIECGDKKLSTKIFVVIHTWVMYVCGIKL